MHTHVTDIESKYKKNIYGIGNVMRKALEMLIEKQLKS